MSDLVEAAEWPGVIGAAKEVGLVTQTETVLGGLVLQEDTVAGVAELFASRVFELKDVAETVVLEPQVRIYEELVIRVQRVGRDEVVSAVLRREQAEVIATGTVAGAAVTRPAAEGAC